MFSPADRVMAMTLPSSSSRIFCTESIRRASSTSTSMGTSAKRVISFRAIALFSGLCPELTDQVHGVLAQLIGCVHDFGVGLVTALVDDHIGEFLGDIHGRSFQLAAQNFAAASGVGHADGGGSG